MSDLTVHTTDIPGLLVIQTPVHADDRGWFKENWQREKMVGLGLPDFGPVQNNVSFNSRRGATRGIHAEPWDKYVAVLHGRIFGAWVDLREGPSFGKTFTIEAGPETAIFVPRGVGNSFQALEDNTVYSYLVNDHWSPDAKDRYTFLNLRDETAAIAWPIDLDQCDISDADMKHPRLEAVKPFTPRRPLIIGAGGQLGTALQQRYPNALTADFPELDLRDADAVAALPWRDVDVVLNAAAFTAVDLAETADGRRDAWAINATAVATLARLCSEHRVPLVHVSSDYVFDGTVEEHTETEPMAPLGVYAQTKAAGDIAASSTPQHYILRTSWVVGDGKNFVRTMSDLARRGIKPSVVNDQFGRLTFTSVLVDAIDHLLTHQCPYGTYNVTNSGPTQTWCDIAQDIYELEGCAREDVTGVTSAAYGEGKDLAPRPTYSTLSLEKISAVGFTPPKASDDLRRYLSTPALQH